MPNPNPTALEPVYGRMSSGGCEHFTWVVTADDPGLGLTVGQKLRESVVAGVGVFWRVIDPNVAGNLPSHPDVTKIDLLVGSGGGGGGGGSITPDREYFYWRVKTADSALGLAVDDLVRESIVSDVSTWRKLGSSTNLASAPDNSKIEPAGQDSIVSAVNSAATAVTANQLTIIDLLSNDIPGDPYGVIGTAGQPLTLTIPAAPRGKRRVLQALTCTYSGGTLPVSGLRVTITYGQGGQVQSFTLTNDGPAPIDLGKNGTMGQVAILASGDVVSPITITMPASGTLVPEIMATAALGV